LLGAGAGALLAFEVVVLAVLELELVFEPALPDTAVLVANGLAPPEPQPTMEAMAKAATLNLMKTLDVKPT